MFLVVVTLIFHLVKHSEILDLENKNLEIASFPDTTEVMRHHYAVNPFLVISPFSYKYLIDFHLQVHKVSV